MTSWKSLNLDFSEMKGQVIFGLAKIIIVLLAASHSGEDALHHNIYEIEFIIKLKAGILQIVSRGIYRHLVQEKVTNLRIHQM